MYYDKNEVKQINSIEQLLEEVARFVALPDGGTVYFRGHNKESYKLLPTIGRCGFYKHGGQPISVFTKAQEQDLLHRFTRYACAYTQRELKPWEALCMARHHGLPVRLLDWTSNPLVALYFAVEFATDPVDGAIWALKRIKDTSKNIDVLTDERPPLKIPGVRLIYPTYISPRMIAQSTFFTLHGKPWLALEEADPSQYKNGEFDIQNLEKWVVLKDKKAELLDTLERIAINSRTLFPDLDGLAKGLWQLEAIRRR